MTEGESVDTDPKGGADIDGSTDATVDEGRNTSAAGAPCRNEHDSNGGDDRDGDGRHGNGGSDTDRLSLAAYVRDASERGDSEESVIERVRASYDREVPYRRVKRLVDAERERLEREGTELSVEEHAPRYADLDDITSLTDTEFGRVVAYLVGERDGHSEVVLDTELADSSDDAAATGDTASVEGKSGATVDEDHRDGERIAGGEDVNGTEIRWHRTEETILVRAVAAEPGRVVDADLVRRVYEKNRAVHGTNGDATLDDAVDERGNGEHGRDEGNGDGIGNGGNEKREPVGTAIVTVTHVVPGAARLAVRSGVTIYDRVDVRRWLDEARLATGTFGSLIEGR